LSDSPVLFDANVWVALAFDTHPHHTRAVEAFRSTTPARPAVFCRSTQQSFLRLASTPAVLRLCNATGLTNQDALVMLAGFMASPSIAYRDEPPGTVPLWHRLAGLPSASPHVWMDAYLAAFAIAGGLELVTFDKTFSQFAGLTPTILTAGNP
jgi:toxin-antitoxin system PIN domain toxin